MTEQTNALATKRSEIGNKVIDFWHNLNMAEKLVEEGIVTAIIPGGPPGLSAYEITEFIIPELMNEIEDAMSLPGQIDMAVSEYDSLFRQRDIVSKDYIAQYKLKNNLK